MKLDKGSMPLSNGYTTSIPVYKLSVSKLSVIPASLNKARTIINRTPMPYF